MLQITKVNSASAKDNIIYLINQHTGLAVLGLNPEELAFVEKEIQNKETLIILNRFDHWIFVQYIDKTLPLHKNKETLRKAGHSLCQMLQKKKLQKVCLSDNTGEASLTLSLAEGIMLSDYQFLKYFKDAKERTSSLMSLQVVSPNVTAEALKELQAVCEAVYTARDLVNEPASYLTAVKLGEVIKQLAKNTGFKAEVFDKEKIQSLKMGGVLGVNQGSTEPPTFSVLEWKPKNAVNTKPVVLVGKGIVYDTGGYSLKPTPDSMDYMKCDMAGAAVVISLFTSLAKTNLPLYVIGLIPSTDNRIGPDAYAPGDIITISDGTTVEVLNTDAEGRLVLADAICFANKYEPELIIDIATLTGAAHRAIGTAGMVGMGNASSEIVSLLTEAGFSEHERIAVFPFWDEYFEQLKSDIADLKNIGGELAGAITAGKFLEYFTKFPYFHLDIAGVAFTKKTDSYRGVGGTGSGVRLLYRFLSDFSALKK